MKKKKKTNALAIIITVLLALFILGYAFAGLVGLALDDVVLTEGNIALIPVHGVIMTQSQGGVFASGGAIADVVVGNIEKAAKNPEIKAIIVDIDSPGGSPVATDEIATAIKDANKTTVALIHEAGASGGYWIASATDHIVANKLSITGSIGVLGSYLDFSGLLADYNISYERLNGGQYKDLGIPFRELSSEERRLLQKKIDLIHQVFKDEVRMNRGLSRAQVDAIATGEFYLGMEAKDLGLVDELGGKKEALAYLEEKLDEKVSIVSYKEEPGFFEALASIMQPKSPFLQQRLTLT